MKVEELLKQETTFELYPYRFVSRLSKESARILNKIAITKGVSMNRVLNVIIENHKDEV